MTERPTPYYEDDLVTLYHGDCLDVLRALPDASVDAVVTDPPYGLGFMGKEWDDLPPGLPFAAECLRVLKPGGHLLAFGGTRTWHRLACAVEDAGFEVRDSIAWLYGSGFPKSLDVSKAIDKRRDWSLVERLSGEIRRARAEAGLSLAEIGQATLDATDGTYGKWYHRGGHMFFETGRSLPSRPEWEHLRHVLPIAPEFVEVYDEAEREVIGSRTVNGAEGSAGGYADGIASQRGLGGVVREIDVTAPATPDAERWQGWGTALKPAWESVVVGRKPPALCDRIGSRLDALEDECRRLANGAARSSVPTRHDSPEVTTATAPASAATPPEGELARTIPTGAAADSSETTATSWSEWQATTCSNIVTSWKRSLAVVSQPTSTSTTATTSGMTTDLTTLWSSLSQITEPSTLLSETSPDGLSSLARIVDDLFGAALLNWRATRTLTATEPATSAMPHDSPDGGARLSPIVVARKPLSGTVAANVLAHGTGALNIDGCRVGDEIITQHGRNDSENTSMSGRNYAEPAGRAWSGRWPANVILDESQAAALDGQSGESVSRKGERPGALGRSEAWTRPAHADYAPRPDAGFDDTGGASRFFYVAKADQSERVKVDGIAHPTVKPLDLMRWLVRLVTPPGGTVLEPFAGSGTTVEACLLEGFKCIAIEREADYLPLIQQRIDRRLNPVAAIRSQGEEGGLFDLLNEETA